MDDTPEKTTDPRSPMTGAGAGSAPASGTPELEAPDHRQEAKSRFNAALAEAKAGLSELGAEAKLRANVYRDQAKSKGDDWSSDARSMANDYAEQGRSAASELAQEGKSRASEALSSLSRMIAENAATIDSKLGPRYGDYARTASRSLQDTADTLDERSVEEIGEDARQLIRTNPGAAVGIAAFVGFMLGRTFGGSKSKKAD